MNIKLICKRVNKYTGEKYPTKKEVASFANRLLKDYCKKFDKTIVEIDYDEFVFDYLNIDIQFQMLTLDGSILGTTIQKDGWIVTYSFDGAAKMVEVKRGDIFIDSKACGCDEREWFTIFHEIKHRFEDLDKDFKVDKIIDNNQTINGIFCPKTKLGWAEFFANYFAACILLPKKRLKKLYDEKHFLYVTQYNKTLNGKNIRYLKEIIFEINKETPVSQSAIAVRLKETGLITNETFNRLDYKFGKEAEMLFRKK